MPFGNSEVDLDRGCGEAQPQPVEIKPISEP